MIARAAATVPFARAAALLAELAGIALTVKRTERSAEADGAAAARAVSAEADAIRSRRLVPLPPAGPLPTSCTSPLTAPESRSSPAKPKTGAGRPPTARPAPARSS